MKRSASIFLALIAWGAAGVAQAGCDLSSCPVVQTRELGTSSTLRVPINTQLTGYDFSDQSGVYSRTDAGLEFWGRDNIVVSAIVPVVVLSPDDSESQVGLGNPMANVQIVTHPLSWLTVAGGMLIESPFGDDALVDSHWVSLNHLQARVTYQALELRLHGGYLRAFGGSEGAVDGHGDGHGHSHGHSHGHGHGGSPASPVDPHADQELRAQGTFGVQLDGWAPLALWESASELDGASLGTQYHSLGAMVRGDLRSGLTGQARFLVPVSDAERYTWRAGLGLTYQR